MKVAFATKDKETIDDHFGWAKCFAVYDITRDGYKLHSYLETPDDHTEEDDKINYKIESLQGCSIVFCLNIGPTAATKVVKARIHPIKVKGPTPIQQEAEALVELIKGNPPPWIKRILVEEEKNG